MRRYRIVSWGSVLLLLLGCQTTSWLNMDGVRLSEQGAHQAAMDRFNQVIANNPSHADAYYNLASTYHRLAKRTGRQGDIEQAENLYNQCLDRSPGHADCYRGLTVLLADTGRHDAALRLLNGWEARQPSSADAKIELARFYDEMGNRPAAKQRLMQALAANPNHPRALSALGRLREIDGEHQQALANYERSLQGNRFQPQIAARASAIKSTLGHAPAVSGESPRLVQEPALARWNRY